MILNSPTISGSLTVSGSLIVTGTTTVTASSATSASYATSASNALAAQSASYWSGSITNALSASYANNATLAANSTLFNSTASAVFATTGSNTLTGITYHSNTNDATAFSGTTSSIYTDGGLQVTKNAYLSSSLYIKGNLTVYGTQSVSYITSSTLNISTNLITVNTSTPSVRFGGIAVQDSGSVNGLTGSLLWDSQNNTWIYTNPSGGLYDGGMLLMGPPNYSASGNEVGITTNALSKGAGSHHMTSSGIFESGTSASFYNNVLAVSSSGLLSINSIANGVGEYYYLNAKGSYGAGLSIYEYSGTQYINASSSMFLRYNNAGSATGSSSGIFAIASGSSEVLRITAAGSVNIGRTDDFYKFSISSGFPKTETNGKGLMFIGSNEAIASNPFGLVVTVTGAASIANRYVTLGTTDFGLANGGNLILQSVGNVGIGLNPGYKLDVYRGASGVVLNLQGIDAYSAETGLTFSTARAKISGFLEAGGGTPGAYLSLYTQPTDGSLTERMRVASNGLVSINNTVTSTNYKLGVSGSAYVNGSNGKGIFITDGASYASVVGLNSAISAYNGLELRASGTDYQIYLSTNGNVGIRASSPRTMLQVTPTSNAETPVLGTATGAVTFTSANTNYGIQFNSTSDGTYFIQSQRFDASATAYALGLNPAGGVVYLGPGYGATNHRIDLPVSQGSGVLVVSGYNGSANDTAIFYGAAGANPNGAATALAVTTNNSTGRSISAGGTINASGADYAEYMTKAIEDNIAKGDIVGVNSNAKLTNIFADAISFAVKSTDPSYVGGDIWGNEEALGEKRPLRTTDQTEEEFAPILAEFEAKLETARAKVDRIAFSGQVPCNVTGANVGDYIIPIELENGKIGGQAVTNPTFEQYQISVGKVWKIMNDGRAWIAVKIG